MMIEIQTPQGVRGQVKSGYDARTISRAVTYGNKDDTPNVPINHRKDLAPVYDDEAAFFHRSLEHGDPVIDKETMVAAENGLRAIVKTGKIYRNVTPDEAQFFLDVLEQSRGVQIEDATTESVKRVPTATMPELELIETAEAGEITAYRQIQQAA